LGLKFFLEFLRHPIRTGAVAPSSRRLAREMVSDVDIENASVVVEYGPGTGAFTGEILSRLKPGALFFAIEKNPILLAEFRKKFPRVRAHLDSVENVGELLREEGGEAVDLVICGLPWASFGGDLQDLLLDATLNALSEGGRFATFAYLQGLLLPSGRAFRRKLRERFSSLSTSPVVWRNFPPAFVYRGVK